MSTDRRKEVDLAKPEKGAEQPQDLAVPEAEQAAVKGGRTMPWPGMKRRVKRLHLRVPGMRRL